MKKYALVIGVEEYRDSMISRLQYARSDATALAERLRGRCAFDQVRVLAESTGSDEPLLVNIVSAPRDISGELCPEDLFLFFFAGHGVEKDGHGYLLARDSLQAYPEHGSLSLELLRKSFEKLCASKRVLLLDACRNDPDAGRGDSANRMGEVISRDIVAAARSRQGGGTTTALLSACRSGQRAYEWPTKGHGVFTQYLIEGLDGAAWEVGELEFERLAAFAADRVRQWSANTPGLPIPQEPWYEKFGDPGSIILATEQAETTSRREPCPPGRVETARPTVAVARWWLFEGGAQRGPLDDAAVRERVRNGTLLPGGECWREGMTTWMRIGETPEWAGAFPPIRQPAPAPQPPPRPQPRRPVVTLPDFLDPVSDAEYARLGALAAGSEAAQQLQKEWVAKGYPLEVALKKTGMAFRLVPPGEFLMGSDGTEGSAGERPRHKVVIAQPLYVGKHPVTQSQWRGLCGENPASFQTGKVLEKGGLFKDEKRLTADTANHPVEQVSWIDCQRFLEIIHARLDLESGKAVRLLSEAEWEYACRAGTAAACYGNLADVGWVSGNSGGATHPVGAMRPNAWGLHDMIGNVWEWCEDKWHNDYTGAPSDGSAWISGGVSLRVNRGGSWSSSATYCRAAFRNGVEPVDRSYGLGFRLALSPAVH